MIVHDHTPAGAFADGNVMMANRAQARHAMLVDGFRHVIADSAVLLLGAGDGRWCYSFAAAGALRVVGVEPQAELVAQFGRQPDLGLRERIELRCADPVGEAVGEAAAERRHDVIALMDVLEGRADLDDLFRALAQLAPKLVIGDGLFAVTQEPVLLLDGARRPMPGHAGLRLVPSRGAIALLARRSGFDIDWIDWRAIAGEARSGISDYYQAGAQCRASFTVIPRG